MNEFTEENMQKDMPKGGTKPLASSCLYSSRFQQKSQFNRPRCESTEATTGTRYTESRQSFDDLARLCVSRRKENE